MSISFLSPPRKGESFYSFICRHRRHTGSNYHYISKTFFNGYAHPVNQRLPFDLINFARKIDQISLLTAEEIITNHTLFSLYSAFMRPKEAQALHYFMMNERGYSKRFVKIDIDASEFSYCRLCAEEEVSEGGESFWHVHHTIPFLQACTKHECLLEIWRVPREIYNVRHYYECDVQKFGNTLMPNRRPSSVLLSGAKTIEDIQERSHSVDLASFSELAQKKGLLKIQKNTYSLNKFMVEAYIDFLERSNILFAQVMRSRPIVLHRLFNGKMHPHNPQNFAFLKQFLDSRSDIKMESSFKTIECCNKFCKDFNKSIEQRHLIRTHVNYKTEPGAKVICPNCGMEFLVSLKPSSQHKVVIKDHGWLIRKMIRSNLKRGISFRKLEEKLGLDRKLIAKLSIGKVKPEKGEHKNFIKLRNERRARWENELKSPAFFSIQRSGEILKTEYRWLQKKDSKWLLKINARFSKWSTGRQKTPRPNTREFKRKLREIKLQLLKLNIPRKISVMLISSHLAKRERTQMVMHATIKAYCKSLAESYHEFNARRSNFLKTA